MPCLRRVLKTSAALMWSSRFGWESDYFAKRSIKYLRSFGSAKLRSRVSSAKPVVHTWPAPSTAVRSTFRGWVGPSASSWKPSDQTGESTSRATTVGPAYSIQKWISPVLAKEFCNPLPLDASDEPMKSPCDSRFIGNFNANRQGVT